jgi:hypothetical protein
MEASYLREPTPQGGSGFGGTAAQWRSSRCQICQAIDRDGTFLDAGCANGHLMESIAAWCAERGFHVKPYGFDLSAALVAEARRRLPQWADRIWVGNALDWVAPGGRLLVSNYVPAEQRSRYPAAVLASLGFRVDGVTTPGGRDGRPVPPTAWVLRAAEDS